MQHAHAIAMVVGGAGVGGRWKGGGEREMERWGVTMGMGWENEVQVADYDHSIRWAHAVE